MAPLLTKQWTPDDLQALMTSAGYTTQVEQTQHWVIVLGSCRTIR